MRILRTLGVLLTVASPVLGAAQEYPAAPPPRTIALTFDDLPVTGTVCDSVEVTRITVELTATLRARTVPAAGFVTPERPCLTPALLGRALDRWVAIGAVIGNHSATHPDFNSTPVAAYLENIELAQAMIDRVVAAGDRWFRAPHLHTGNDTAKARALSAHPVANGYRVAPVTVDNQEFVYAAVYAHARRSDDQRLARRALEDGVAVPPEPREAAWVGRALRELGR